MEQIPSDIALAAIDDTQRTIERRARLYRRLVIVVVVSAMSSLALAIFLRSLLAGIGIAILPLIVGSYFATDAGIVRAWRARILRRFQTCGFALTAFVCAMREYPALPSLIVASMLSCLSTDQISQACNEGAPDVEDQRMRSQQYRAVISGAILSSILGLIVVYWTSGRVLYVTGSTILLVLVALLLNRTRKKECPHKNRISGIQPSAE